EPNSQTDIFLVKDPIAPPILATPKPTAFQHYLVQTSDIKDTLKHYGNGTPHETVIRGHKLYWHRGKVKTEDISTEPDEKSKQHTQFKPVKPEVNFEFKIYFENLSNEELGALCWILRLQGESEKTYLHKLGMGKAFGMGAVELKADL